MMGHAVHAYVMRNVLVYLDHELTLLRLRQWYDLLHRGARNDICGTLGFLTAVRDTMRIRQGGLLFAGLPCSSSLGFNFGDLLQGLVVSY